MNARAIGIVMDESTQDLPVFTRMTSGLSFIAQRVRVRTLTHLGDWKLDKTAGMDWLSFLGGQKPADAEGLAASLAIEWAGTPGVVAVEDLSWDDATPGLVTVSANLRTTTGESIIARVEAPGIDGNPGITCISPFLAGVR